MVRQCKAATTAVDTVVTAASNVMILKRNAMRLLKLDEQQAA
jgi:hypothetical protein